MMKNPKFLNLLYFASLINNRESQVLKWTTLQHHTRTKTYFFSGIRKQSSAKVSLYNLHVLDVEWACPACRWMPHIFHLYDLFMMHLCSQNQIFCERIFCCWFFIMLIEWKISSGSFFEQNYFFIHKEMLLFRYIFIHHAINNVLFKITIFLMGPQSLYFHWKLSFSLQFSALISVLLFISIFPLCSPSAYILNKQTITDEANKGSNN